MVRIGRFGAYLEAKRVSDDGEEELIKATCPGRSLRLIWMKSRPN